MNPFEKISDGLNRLASATSRRRVKGEEARRAAHHGGSPRDLYLSALPFADEIEKRALQIESDL